VSIEHTFEDYVMEYLTRDPYVFLNAQYSIKDDAGDEWACPDFVALNFRDRSVSVVEVSTGYNPEALANKVRDCEHHWFSALRKQLARRSIVDGTWTFEVEVFIRKNAIEQFRAKIGNRSDVIIHALEVLGMPWQRDWPRAD